MKLKSIIGLLVFSGFLLSSCTNVEEKIGEKAAIVPMQVNNDTEKVIASNEEGKKLMETKCYACHNPKTASHDDILAPPLVAVKRRYSKAYDNRADFIDGMVNWTTNPNEDDALMRGAVTNFKVMPKMGFEADDMRKIAEYIYDNEIEQPSWFKAHFKEQHPNGMGNGMGKGKH